jgi:hypothetical protein
MRTEPSPPVPRLLPAFAAVLAEMAAVAVALTGAPFVNAGAYRIHKYVLAFGLHVGAAVLISLAFRKARQVQHPSPRRRRTTRLVPVHRGQARSAATGHDLSPLALSVALLFPVLGPLAMVLTIYLRRFERTSEVRNKAHRLDSSVRFRAAHGFRGAAVQLRPFVELVSSQDREDDAMVAAIENVSVLEEHTAAHLLRHALASKIPETRLYAADRLAKIEEKVSHQLQLALKAHQKYPEESELLRRVADARLRYGSIGLPGDPLTRFHLTEAIRFYKECLLKLPTTQRSSCTAKLALACLRAGEVAEACHYFAELVDAGAREEQILSGCVEACFASGSYEKLRRYLAIGRDRCPESRLLQEVAHVWL